MNIKYETAQKICFCYNQIEAAEELLKHCMEQIEKNGSLSWEEHGRVSHMSLGVPTSLSGHRILQVDQELSIKMIQKHIQNKKFELKSFNLLAYKELKSKRMVNNGINKK